MAANEHERHELFRKLAELIGEEHAGILMRHLPPSEWPELATKDDLERGVAELRADLRAEFGHLRAEFGGIRAEVHAVEARLLTQMTRQSRTFILTTVTAVVGSVGATAAIAFAAAGLV